MSVLGLAVAQHDVGGEGAEAVAGGAWRQGDDGGIGEFDLLLREGARAVETVVGRDDGA
ncbi:MAG: hypothetical protein JWL77_6422, partial [Chthonomonadaceae bacterium]|nr:hypothetical protein [Chthonomonadaceae bacterium]